MKISYEKIITELCIHITVLFYILIILQVPIISGITGYLVIWLITTIETKYIPIIINKIRSGNIS